ncbi:complex I NDUFA9 subunit family protein [Acetobacteraceae bacterium H6797]|nr:complex I NDUFA9 subunit family protein [Acetobacteraceae bacterium H6797]
MRKVATVFGGTGFIGSQVTQRLLHLDYVVRVVTRDPDKVRALATDGVPGQIVPLVPDITSEADITRAVAGADAVVSLIGLLYEKRPGAFARTHTELPGLIARAARLAKVRRLTHISAIGASPESPSLYARTKAGGEALLREHFPAATILRPSIVFGPGDGFFNRFAQLARLLPFMPVVRGDTRLQPVYVGDVADAVIATLTRDDTPGRLYELGGPRIAPFRDWLRLVLEVTGRRRRLVELPDGLVALQARIGDHLPNPPLTTDQLRMLSRDNVVSEGALTLADLGITPAAAEAIIPGYLNLYRHHRPINQ